MMKSNREKRPEQVGLVPKPNTMLVCFEGPNQYGATGASLQRYFDAYALAARRSI